MPLRRTAELLGNVFEIKWLRSDREHKLLTVTKYLRSVQMLYMCLYPVVHILEHKD